MLVSKLRAISDALYIVHICMYIFNKSKLISGENTEYACLFVVCLFADCVLVGITGSLKSIAIELSRSPSLNPIKSNQINTTPHVTPHSLPYTAHTHTYMEWKLVDTKSLNKTYNFCEPIVYRKYYLHTFNKN